jgi:arylsulfatase A-like enzyme
LDRDGAGAFFFATASDTLASLQEPFALWLHTGLLGRVWDAPYDYRARFAEEDDPEPPEFIDPPSGPVPANTDPDELLGIRQAYAGQIALLDECLLTFLEAWDDDPRSNNTWLVVLSARGYPLGEHGRWGWANSVGQAVPDPTTPAFAGHELLHLPVFIRAPDRARATERATVLTQPCDLWATVAEALSVPHQEPTTAARWPTGSWWSAPLFSAEWAARDRMFTATGPAQAQLQTAQWWYAGEIAPTALAADQESTDNAQERLYLLPEDYFGVNNVADRCGEETAACGELLAAWQTARAAQDSSCALQPLPEVLTQTVL